MAARPRLSRELVTAPVRQAAGVEMPPAAALALPERAVQFGTGALLRGFVDYLVDAANRKGGIGGRIVAVSSTASGRDDKLNAQDGLYTLIVRGLVDGAPRECRRVVGSLSRAISAAVEWNAVLAVARDPNIEVVFSNTTEVGIVLDADDPPDAPRSFPGRLTAFLFERAVAFEYDAARGVVVLPCELIEKNGDKLGEIVRALATRWSLGPRFDRWLDEAVPFCNTLVDRIVTGAPQPSEADRLAVALGYDDAMITVCEPYRLFAIEAPDALRSRLRLLGDDPGIVVTTDITPYRERKVRVLNGAHTITVSVALLAGLQTVREALDDERVGPFMRRVVMDEILPSLSVPDGEQFAASVFDRFGNPFLEHALVDITLQGTMKMRTRIVPSVIDYHRRTGRVPAGLALGFAAFLLFVRGEGLRADAHATALRDHWRGIDLASNIELAALARRVCDDTSLWGDNLGRVPNFAATVAEQLVRLCRQGVVAALESFVAIPQSSHPA